MCRQDRLGHPEIEIYVSAGKLSGASRRKLVGPCCRERLLKMFTDKKLMEFEEAQVRQ
jgi:hypothetical protein